MMRDARFVNPLDNAVEGVIGAQSRLVTFYPGRGFKASRRTSVVSSNVPPHTAFCWLFVVIKKS